MISAGSRQVEESKRCPALSSDVETSPSGFNLLRVEECKQRVKKGLFPCGRAAQWPQLFRSGFSPSGTCAWRWLGAALFGGMVMASASNGGSRQRAHSVIAGRHFNFSNLAGLSVRLRTLEIAAWPLLGELGSFINSTRRFIFSRPST